MWLATEKMALDRSKIRLQLDIGDVLSSKSGDKKYMYDAFAPGALSFLVLASLSFGGDRIFIVSRTNQGNCNRKGCWAYKWLSNIGAFDVLKVPEHNLQFVVGWRGDRGKGPWAKHFGVTHIVDDIEDHLIACRAYAEDTLSRAGLLLFGADSDARVARGITPVSSFTHLAQRLGMQTDHLQAVSEFLGPLGKPDSPSRPADRRQFAELYGIMSQRFRDGCLHRVTRSERPVGLRKAFARIANACRREREENDSEENVMGQRTRRLESTSQRTRDCGEETLPKQEMMQQEQEAIEEEIEARTADRQQMRLKMLLMRQKNQHSIHSIATTSAGKKMQEDSAESGQSDSDASSDSAWPATASETHDEYRWSWRAEKPGVCSDASITAEPPPQWTVPPPSPQWTVPTQWTQTLDVQWYSLPHRTSPPNIGWTPWPQGPPQTSVPQSSSNGTNPRWRLQPPSSRHPTAGWRDMGGYNAEPCRGKTENNAKKKLKRMRKEEAKLASGVISMTRTEHRAALAQQRAKGQSRVYTNIRCLYRFASHPRRWLRARGPRRRLRLEAFTIGDGCICTRRWLRLLPLPLSLPLPLLLLPPPRLRLLRLLALVVFARGVSCVHESCHVKPSVDGTDEKWVVWH